MGGRQSRSALTTYADELRNSEHIRIAANPNMLHRPLPEIPRSSPTESASTQLPTLTATASAGLSRPESEAARREQADTLRVAGNEHIYPHRRRHHHHHRGNPSASSLESLLRIRGISSRIRCPLCSKEMTGSELEQHIIVCLAKPKVLYNVDALNYDAGECTICLDDMTTGDKIARLPCLCVYHVRCIEQWYKVNPTCPVHPEAVSNS